MRFLLFLLIILIVIPVNASIVVTISDFKPIVKAITGDKLEVVSLLPAGSDPHHFSLSGKDIELLKNADLIVLTNSELFGFERKIKEKFKNVLDFEDYGVELEDFPGYPKNPHGYWLKPENCIAIAKAVKERLSLLYPEYRDYFEENFVEFIKRVKEAEAEANRIAKDVRGKNFVAAVPGVCYIASSLGVNVSAVLFSESYGFLSGKELEKIRGKLKSGEYVGIIIPEFMKGSKVGEVVEQLSRDTGCRVAYVRFSMGDVSYETALISNAARIAYSQTKRSSGNDEYLYVLSAICLLEAGALLFIGVRK